MANLRWKLITIAVVLVVFAGVGVYPIVAARYGVHSPGWLMDKQLKLGLDLNGGVQLVLRVQTDDALKLETDTEMERLRAGAGQGEHHLHEPDVARSDALPHRGRADAAGRGVPAGVQRSAGEFRSRVGGPNGTYVFTMKPNIVVQLRAEAVVQARQTIERRVNELGVTEPSIAQQGDDQLSVQLPGVTDVDRAKSIIGSPGLLELKIVEQGPASTAESLQVNGQVPAGMDVVPGAHGAGDASSHVLLSRAQGRGRHRARHPHRARVARREQPAGRQLHVQHRRRTQVRQRDRRQHRPSAGDHPRRPRAVGAAHRLAHHDRRADHRQLHAGRSRPTCR